MKRHAPATHRNRAPILDVLRRLLPSSARVVEVASGSGEHAVFFARALPGVSWQPTDVDADALASIDAHAADEGLANVLPARRVDAREPGWADGLREGDAPHAIFASNMIHIAPFEACVGLFAGGARLLRTGELVVLYGPFRFGGEFSADSNAAFDASLRARDPTWGVRDLDDVSRVAAAAGFDRAEVVALPANNHVVAFRAR
ncbi:MAG TPA: DUF938 domain-containing protein [Byssovorax sp.]|jgi:hypothetical protein